MAASARAVRSWSMVPLVLLRSTGFSPAALDAVRTPDVAARCDALIAARRAVAAAQDEFAGTLFPSVLAGESARGATRDDFKAWYLVRRRVKREQQVSPLPPVIEHCPSAVTWVEQWNRLVLAVEIAEREAETAAEHGHARAVGVLRECARDGRFAEAVFLSSPSMYQALLRYRDGAEGDRRAATRRVETQLYGYLQRFAAKNETTSFFGPVGHGVPVDDPGLSVRAYEDPVERLTRPAYWVVQGLADVIADSGVVERRLIVPSDEHDPLGWLRRAIEGRPVPDAVNAVLDRLDDVCKRFATAPVEEKVRLLDEAERLVAGRTGAEGRGGGMYADRTVLYDEAAGEVSARIGPDVIAGWRERLTPAMDLCASYSVVVQRACRVRARDLVRRVGGEMPYPAFLRTAVRELTMAGCLADAAVTRFTGALADTARARSDGRVAVLTETDVAPLLEEVPPGTMVSPDVFLAAPDQPSAEAGDVRLVIGEIHHGCQVWTHLLTFWPEREALRERLAAMLPEAADVVYRRKQGKAFPKELPGPAVELGGRSAKPADRVRSAVDLTVVATGDGVILRDRAGREVPLYPGDPRSPVNWLFGTPPVVLPPITLGRCTPRVELGGVVLRRARWRLDAADLEAMRGAGRAATMTRCRERADELGLPSRVFVRVDGQRKPFFVDLAATVGVDYLMAMTAGRDVADLTEMLPDTALWWLRAPDGRRSCEWRMTWISGGGDG